MRNVFKSFEEASVFLDPARAIIDFMKGSKNVVIADGIKFIKREDGVYGYERVDAQNGSYCAAEYFISNTLKSGYIRRFQRGRGGEQGRMYHNNENVNTVISILASSLNKNKEDSYVVTK